MDRPIKSKKRRIDSKFVHSCRSCTAIENSGCQSGRCIHDPRRSKSIFDRGCCSLIEKICIIRGPRDEFRANYWLPLAFRVFLRSSQTSFLPTILINIYGRVFWPRRSEFSLIVPRLSLNMSRIPCSWNNLSHGGFWNDVQRRRFRTPLRFVPAFTIRLW